MAALDFPSASSSPWVAPNGVIYTYIGTSPNGYWEANTANASQNLTNLFVVKTGSTMSGALKLDNAANASNPDLAFDGDSNTGIYSPAANAVGITTAGTQRLVVDSSGNVLVGKATSSGLNAGCEFRDNGMGLFTRASGNPVQVRRLTDDGDLVEFYQDAGLIGSIGVQGTSLTVGMAGPEKLRIDSSGKVGIGCIPVRDLQLHTSDSSSELMLSNSTTGATAGSGFMIQQDGNDTYIWNKENSFMSFGTNSLERIRIDSSGQVGIGTASPSSYSVAARDLVIKNATNAGITIRSGSSSDGSIYFNDTDDGNQRGIIRFNHQTDALAFHTPVGQALVIDSSGRLGLGVVPSAHGGNSLEIHSASSVNSFLSLTNSTTGSGGSAHGFNIIMSNNEARLFNREAGDISFWTSSSEGMRIDSSGNVGIGNSDPGALLQVANSNTRNGAVRIGGNNSGGTGLDITYSNSGTTQTTIKQNYRASNGAALLKIDTGTFTVSTGTAGTEKMRIDSSGRLGVGTSAPTHTLHVVGDYFRFSSANASLGTIYVGTETNVNTIYSQDSAGNAEDFRIMAGSSEMMRINNLGQLGIGTSSPSHPLEVRGVNSQINFSSSGTGGGYLMSSNAGQWGISGGVRWNGAGWYARHTASSIIRDDGDGNMKFFINTGNTVNTYITPVQRMRIDSLGRVYIGKDTAAFATEGAHISQGDGNTNFSTGGGTACTFNRSTNTGIIVNLAYNGSTIGNISTNGSTVSYNTSSDYRLKENIIDITDSITRVKQLSPKRFNFIADADTTVDGFLAHEAQAVVPEAVTGEKDGEEMQSIDQSKLVPLLTAALQEAIGEIETLKQRLSDAGIA